MAITAAPDGRPPCWAVSFNHLVCAGEEGGSRARVAAGASLPMTDGTVKANGRFRPDMDDVVGDTGRSGVLPQSEPPEPTDGSKCAWEWVHPSGAIIVQKMHRQSHLPSSGAA